MKRTKRIWALLMTLALVLTYMPVMAFAEDGEEGAAPVEVQEEAVAEAAEAAAEDAEPAAVEEIVVDEEQPEVAEVEATAEEAAPKEAANAAAKPVSIKFTTEEPLWCFVGDEYASCYNDGCAFTITYSDKTTKTYKYVGYDEATDHEYNEYYLNGDKKTLMSGDIWVRINAGSGAVAGNNAATVIYESEDETRVETAVQVKGVVSEDIKSAKYIRKDNKEIEAKYEYGYVDWQDDGANFAGDKIVLGYNVEIEKYNEDTDREYTVTESRNTTFVCKKVNGDYIFVYESGDEDWADIWPSFKGDTDDDDWLPGNSYNVNVYVDGFKADGGLTVNVKGAPVPTNVEFVPAAGFTPESYIGETFVDEQAFFGKGNAFIVTYSDNSKRTYKYIETSQNNEWWEGFYLNGSKDDKQLSVYGNTSALKKGDNTVTLTYWESIDGYESECSVDFKANVVANKFNAYVDFKTYKYTGKAITPKVVVKDTAGKTLPPSAYSYNAKALKKNKNVGYYDFEVTIKDTANYPEKIWATYAIVPKATSIKSVKAGKKSFTVKWKKFSKKDQKSIDGFIIEYSTDKNFDNIKTVKVSKKSASKAIKKLGAKKTYYVRVYSYKKVKQYGETYLMYSNASKTKKVKTK